MTPARRKTVDVEPGRAGEYWKRAEQNRDGMQSELTAKRWDAAALLAIHAAISAADAICIRREGVRNAGEHGDAVDLLRRTVAEADGLKENVTRLDRLLARKSDTEYGDRLVTEARARDIAKNVERFLDWARPLAIPC